MALQACGPFQRLFRHTSPDEIHGTWESKVPEGEEYTQYTIEALQHEGAQLIEAQPADAAEFCPAYPYLDQNGRIAFWVGLISAMSKYESSYDTSSQFEEKMVDSTGKKVVSRGLLQLSIESSRKYGCQLTTDQDLHDAQTNLKCAVQILSSLVLQDNWISNGQPKRWLGGARYWHVLRPDGKLEAIRGATRALSVCQPLS